MVHNNTITKPRGQVQSTLSLEGGAAEEFNQDFLEEVTTEPKNISNSLTDR